MAHLQLAWLFLKTGLFTIGGGLASLPLLHTYLVKGGWIAEAEFIDMIALSQSTPGPIGINMATFTGYRTAGIGGALIATICMIAPSFIILTLIARGLKAFERHPLVRGAMAGLRPAAMGMIAAASWFILRSALFIPGPDGTLEPHGAAILIFALLLPFCFIRRIHPLFCILAGAGASIVLRGLGGS